MAFTFTVTEWDSVNDPDGMFRRSGQSEGEIGSGGKIDVSTASFDSLGTAQVTTARADGRDEFPDDDGARLDSPVTLNGIDYAPGSNVEADFEMILVDPASGLHFRATWLAIDNQPVGISISRGWDIQQGRYVPGAAGLYAPGTTLTLIDGDSLRQTPNLADFTRNASFLSSGAGTRAQLDRDGAVVCFAADTRIATPIGERPVQSLRVGDLVLTRDHGAQPVRWTAGRHVGSGMLSAFPKLRPIRIAAGALGAGLPRRDLLLSPQHRVLVRSAVARRMFDVDEVLIAAHHLVGLPGIARQDDLQDLDYWHFACDRHEIVLADGAPAETLFPGPQALRALHPAARTELLTLFPDLTVLLEPARPFAEAGAGRNLARRHLRNTRPLLSPVA